MRVSLGTLRNGEQERREPQGPARALLLIASKRPAAVLAALEAAIAVVRGGAHKMAAKSKSLQARATMGTR